MIALASLDPYPSHPCMGDILDKQTCLMDNYISLNDEVAMCQKIEIDISLTQSFNICSKIKCWNIP